MRILPTALMPLGKYRQFIVWRLESRQGARNAKIPVHHQTATPIDAHNPVNQLDFMSAAGAALQLGDAYGVGFVFTEHDPFFFLDLDDCYINGEWSAISQWACGLFPNAAVEISQSGVGLHIIGAGKCAPHGIKNRDLGIDLFTSGRFVALTEKGVRGDAGTDYTQALQHFAATYFPIKTGADAPPEWTDAPVATWQGPEDDGELLRIALKAQSGKSSFGGAASFKNLWEADADILGRFYSDPSGTRAYDASSADAALAQHLAFYTGNNCERIARLMQQSSLVRDKWTQHGSYIERTVLSAISRQKSWYSGGQPIPPDELTAIDAREPRLLSGAQILTIDQQMQLFKGCTYVQDLHRILTPDGAQLKPDQFRAAYGGREFIMDAVNGRPTKNAWEAFTESRGARFPKVHGVCFKPLLESGAIVEDEGRMLVNTYLPIKIRRTEGDPTRFLDHLNRILPHNKDRAILLAYMAACVQHIGVKFQWAPLIQGVEGNGKTLFTRCVANAIGRRYTHYPKAADIDNKFNGWLMDKLFIGVEDIYVPDHRREILETLKPMITGGDGLEIQLKGVDQITVDICANFILNSNHKDALRKTQNDRRFAVFYTEQQESGDLLRDGMGGDYFPNLYDWLRGDGYAIISDFLMGYAIPDELNPATQCHRAPITSSTEEAVTASLGPIEQEILEAVALERPGFIGGWISSMAVDKLLESLGAKRRVPPNKRREMLKRLGFDWHPELTQGRVNNPTLCDAGKPRLFIKNGSLLGNLTQPQEIAGQYDKDQDKNARG